MDRVVGVESRSGRAGSWVGLFGESLTLLLPGAERGRAAELWSVVDDGATLDEVLDLLVSSGLSHVRDFVLVSASGEDVRVLVRGAAQVTAHSREGLVRVRAADRLWQEDAFTGIVALVATLPDQESAGQESFDIQPGLCRVGEVRWGTVPQALPPVPAPVPTPTPVEPVSLGPVGPRATPVRVIDPGAKDPVTAAPPPPSLPPVPPVPPAPPVPAVPAVPPVIPAPPLPDPEPASSPETEPIAATPLAPDWQAEVTEHLPAVEPSGLTLLGFGDQPADSEEVTRPQESGAAVAVLTFSHGLRLTVDRSFLIGRGPTSRPQSEGAELVAVPSPHQEISGTHVEIRPGEGMDLGAAVITDLGSTNGTLLAQPGLAPEDLRPGSPVALLPGAVIDLGDGVTIQVSRP